MRNHESHYKESWNCHVTGIEMSCKIIEHLKYSLMVIKMLKCANDDSKYGGVIGFLFEKRK